MEEQRLKEEEEQRRKAHAEWLRRLRSVDHLRRMHPHEFERLVCSLYRKMGYSVEETPQSGDSGIDGYLRREGKLYLLQCKRVKGSVGEPILRDLYGCITHHLAAGGIIVTTGHVSRQARAWVSGKPIQIVELRNLVEMVLLTHAKDEPMPRDFPTDGSVKGYCPVCCSPLRVMVEPGREYSRCTRYPDCRYTAHLSGRRGMPNVRRRRWS